MAVPKTLQTMWLLLVSAGSTSLQTRTVEREFPQLAQVVFSICGLTDLDFSMSHPCAFAIFGIAYAFTECGVVHQHDYSNFGTCVKGCAGPGQDTFASCKMACADPAVENANCMTNCKVMQKCIKKAAKKAQGQTSANSLLRDCLENEGGGVEKKEEDAAPAPAPAAIATGVAAPFAPRKGILSAERGVTDPKCTCSPTGVVHGINTGQPGCAKHGKEPNAGTEGYCYIEGDFTCGGAMASTVFPEGDGVFYVGCEKTDFHALFPESCEIRNRAEADLFDVPAVLNITEPPASFEDYNSDMAPVPTNNTLDGLHEGLQDMSGPLDAEWHSHRDNKFTDQPFQEGVTPIAGVPLEQHLEAKFNEAAAAAGVGVAPSAAAPADPAAATAFKLRGVRPH